MLELQEKEMLSLLRNDPSYKLLLTKVEAEIFNTIEEIGDNPKKEFLLPIWRALRKIYIILRDTPQKLDEEIKIYKSSLDDTFYTPSKTQMELLQNYYESMLNEKENIVE